MARNPYAKASNSIGFASSLLSHYVFGWFVGVAIVYSGAWLALNFIGWLIFGTDPISGNPGLGG
jgi:hypothetical protein